ncbi:hypothetical protein ACRALDRAFT_206033 [Sodiomyces alcalophilus JCM 7366]|uniref:uncharacterized protein n=1 Tax=Sodiomyces alcalophilus JCM 7366 TaxID=591952 RepID=UPI0039B3C4CD
MEELEEMMFMEAIRLSLAAEEERKRKEEKAERKEAKKKEKEERKAARKNERQGSFYGGSSSASGSSLSLGLGRRRGNSGASHLRMEASVHHAQAAHSTSSLGKVHESPPSTSTGTGTTPAVDKGKGVDRGPAAADTGERGDGPSPTDSSSLPIPTISRGPSHLRQISNASSITSSLADSATGSSTNQDHHGDGDNRRTSGMGHARQGSGATDGDASEPMFNFRSLAEMVGVDIENGESTGTTRSTTGDKDDADEVPEAEHMDQAGHEATEESVATLKPQSEVPEGQGSVGGGEEGKTTELAPSNVATPEVTVTPDAAESESEGVKTQEPSSQAGLEPTPTITIGQPVWARVYSIDQASSVTGRKMECIFRDWEQSSGRTPKAFRWLTKPGWGAFPAVVVPFAEGGAHLVVGQAADLVGAGQDGGVLRGEGRGVMFAEVEFADDIVPGAARLF